MRGLSRKARAEAHSEAQRERILSAARQCFVESGFHAASMANIAETAGVSAGLIYRYFESKNAIILAIIDQQLGEVQADIRQVQSAVNAIEERVLTRFDCWQHPKDTTFDPGLFLEIIALASRDSQVADALRAADQHIRTELNAWLIQAWQAASRQLSDREVRERIWALQCFFEGLAARVIKQPDVDLDLVRGSLRCLLSYVLPGHETGSENHCS